MEMIHLPQLRLAQLQSLTESVFTICDPIEVLASEKTKLQVAFDDFKAGMVKDKASSDKSTLDKTRDNRVSGFMYGVKSEKFFPQPSKEAQEALQKVAAITESYGFKINKLPYDEESAEVDNMLAELSGVDLSLLPGLSRWPALIKEANDNFKQIAKDFLEETVKAASVSSASQAMPALESALNDLFTMFFAHMKISKTEAMEQAYKELTVLINTYR